MDRIELSTSPLPRECSTSELHGQIFNFNFRATNLRAKLERVAGIEPAPSAWKAEVLPLNYTRIRPRTNSAPDLARLKLVVGEGFEPSKAEPSDLQSDPVDRLGTPPGKRSIINAQIRVVNQTLNRKFSTSPSLTTYSLPSERIFPASFAPCSPP
jgi:hypothetical protein